MHLNTIELTNFKNYESQSLEFHSRINGIVGKNGTGKTNLLDAIYYLCMCKSYFGTPDNAVVRHEQDIIRLKGEFEKADEAVNIVAKIRLRRKKEFMCNNLPYSRLSQHIGLLPVVVIAPDDTRLATEGSEYRRKFLDETLCQLNKEYLLQLIHYNKILAQRNAALKQMAKQGRFDHVLIGTYNTQLAPAGTYIHEARKAFIVDFSPIFEQVYSEISNKSELVTCTYKSALYESTLTDLLEENYEKDKILQRTTKGIHRDNLAFIIGEKPVKRFASQGQLKSFILALKLAQYDFIKTKKGIKPVLLLDDIFDKLDATRIQSLIELLANNDFGQVFITDTGEQRLNDILAKTGIDYQMFMVNDAGVSPVT